MKEDKNSTLAKNATVQIRSTWNPNKNGNTHEY
jgi:hypothetical protein